MLHNDKGKEHFLLVPIKAYSKPKCKTVVSFLSDFSLTSKKGMCYSITVNTEIIHLWALVSRKLLTFWGGEHWKNNPKPDISVRQQLRHRLFIHFAHGPSPKELSSNYPFFQKYFKLIVHIVRTLKRVSLQIWIGKLYSYRGKRK